MSVASSLRRWGNTLRRRAKTVVGARPGLYFPLYRPRPAFDGLLVTEETDICIEGFPRSANSFAVQAFQYAQPRPVQIAHHTHVPANPIRACEWGIPTVVLIRPPEDAIVSRIALDKEVRRAEHGAGSARQRVSFAAWIHAWRSFYRALEPYRDRGELLVAFFSVVIEDMGRVIERVNAHFGTGFETFDHTAEAVAAVRSGQGYHASPSDRREMLKLDTRADLEDRLESEPSLRDRMEAAKRLYGSYVGEAAGEAAES